MRQRWQNAVSASLVWFEPAACFRRPGGTAINRALFDLTMYTASGVDTLIATQTKADFNQEYEGLLRNEEFQDLISRSVDHKRRTERRFAMWMDSMAKIDL